LQRGNLRLRNVFDAQIGHSLMDQEYLGASPEGRRVYRAPVDSTWFVVVDAKDKEKFDRIGKGSLVISPDGRRVAYVAEAGTKAVV